MKFRKYIGPWLKQAEQAAANSEEAQQFIYNWKNQISLWGPKGEIIDYARKQWAGQVKDYYYPRWAEFAMDLLDSLNLGTNFTQADYNLQVLTEVEIPFTLDKKTYPIRPTADFVSTMFKFFKRYIQANNIVKVSEPFTGVNDFIHRLM